MAIPVKNTLVQELIQYLDRKAGEGDIEADNLHQELLEDQAEADYEELKIDGKLPEKQTYLTPGGSWIV